MSSPKIVEIPVDNLVKDEENPNRQKDAVFNALVENIQEIGMVEPIMVAPLIEDGEEVADKYKIISGHHRFDACKMLDFQTIPSIIRENFDEDMQKFQLVRMNMLKGSLDPVKFTKLFNRMADKYGEDLVKDSMALVDEKKFQRLYQDVRSELPQEIQDKMDEAEDDIETVDDLSRLLNSLFNEYGDTLDQNFMVFTYGGKTQLWVSMNEDVKKIMMDTVVERLKDEEIDANMYFEELLLKYGLDEDIIAEAKKRSEGFEKIDF